MEVRSLNEFVSVIIPTYNRPIFLAELLHSLLKQTYTHFEVIIVNDAGEDIDDVVALYPELNIKIITMPENQKHVHARNEGLKHAQGKYILLCDDDDLLLPEHIQTGLKELRDNDFIYFDVEIFDYIIEGKTRIPTKHFLFAYEHDLEAMRTFSTFVPSGCMYKREIHQQLGPFDVDMFHYWDWDFFLRVSEQFKVHRVAKATVLYAFSNWGQNSSSNFTSMRKYLDRLSAKHQLGDLPTKNFFLLLEEPELKAREAESRRIWDGKPIISRLAQLEKETKQI